MGKNKGPMRKFVVLGGEHNHHGVTYKKGEVVECAVDLTKIFPNKFRYFVTDQEIDPGDDVVSEAGETEMSFGDDVTADFSIARVAKMKVFSKAGYFHVFSEDDLAAPLSDKPLKTKRAVSSFIQATVLNAGE
uniref:Uncharacterized protein n=1 Tax=viral metagenome TaxID=1070528 RepID=A0A6M3IWP3_9ZZZZ